MLIFKSFVFTLPASIRVCALFGLIMRNAQGDAVVSGTIKSMLFWALEMCPVLHQKCPPCAPSSDPDLGEKAKAAIVSRGPWNPRLQKERTSHGKAAKLEERPGSLRAKEQNSSFTTGHPPLSSMFPFKAGQKNLPDSALPFPFSHAINTHYRLNPKWQLLRGKQK